MVTPKKSNIMPNFSNKKIDNINQNNSNNRNENITDPKEYASEPKILRSFDAKVGENRGIQRGILLYSKAVEKQKYK